MHDPKDGVMNVDLSSWKYFHDFVRQEMLELSHYVWRGQRDATWPLESSLDRQLKGKSGSAIARARDHLKRFQQSVRGRRGSNPSKIEDENEWWALGQHHGLATPLLDWTASPFVALYFSFERPLRPSGGKRSVWALGNPVVKNLEIVESHKSKKPTPSDVPATLDFIRPLQDENARLVAQSGLFTRAPIGVSVDEWVRKNFANDSEGGFLARIIFPELGRTNCLRTLNKMNINHLSLFPDLYGSSLHCNRALEIDRY